LIVVARATIESSLTHSSTVADATRRGGVAIPGFEKPG